MKKVFAILILLLATNTSLWSQGMQEVPAGKALVYFLRPSGFGALVNFSFFDSATVIGRFNGEKYMVYACEPGHHIFWARSENKSFISGTVEAGKTYFIEAAVQMGGIKAGVELRQVDPSDAKKMEKMMKFIGKRSPRVFTPEDLAELSNDLDDVIKRGMKELTELRNTGQTIPVIDTAKFITIPPPATF